MPAGIHTEEAHLKEQETTIQEQDLKEQETTIQEQDLKEQETTIQWLTQSLVKKCQYWN